MFLGCHGQGRWKYGPATSAHIRTPTSHPAPFPPPGRPAPHQCDAVGGMHHVGDCGAHPLRHPVDPPGVPGRRPPVADDSLPGPAPARGSNRTLRADPPAAAYQPHAGPRTRPADSQSRLPGVQHPDGLPAPEDRAASGRSGLPDHAAGRTKTEWISRRAFDAGATSRADGRNGPEDVPRTDRFPGAAGSSGTTISRGEGVFSGTAGFPGADRSSGRAVRSGAVRHGTGSLAGCSGSVHAGRCRRATGPAG